MNKLESDIKLAHDIIEEKEKFDSYYYRFYHMWPFTTINMKEYLAPFKLENLTCATIEGSSDHVFELFLKHPKKIIGIDTNPLTEYYLYLKYAAFYTLKNPKEFLQFFRWNDYPYFCKYNKKAFDKDLFEEMSSYMPQEKREFWEDLFSHYEPTTIRSKLFSNDEGNNDEITSSLNYLSEENYAYIRDNIASLNFQFLNADVRALDEVLHEKVDFLTLSNLIIYAQLMYPDYPLHGFRMLIDKLSHLLNVNGQIVVGYLYDIENENDSREIFNSHLRDAVFDSEEFSYHYFTKIEDLHYGYESKNHDAILLYSPNKKDLI